MKILSNTAKGTKAKKKLKHWIPMCNTWAFNIERYTRLTYQGDSPYNNNERANIGLLAGAAWSCGNIALEEFQSLKGGEGNETNGRIDLWLCSENKKDEYIEAKFKRMSINGNYLKNIKATLEAAVNDAKYTKRDDDEISIGVAFIVFYIKEHSVNDVLSSLDEAIFNINKNINADILSWCFPERDVEFVDSDGYIYPGIIMLGKRV